MDPTALANLLAQLLPLGINLYLQIQQQYSAQVPPLETILAQTDLNWDAIAASANKELSAVSSQPSAPAPVLKAES